MSILDTLIDAARQAADGTEPQQAVADTLAGLTDVDPSELLNEVLERFTETRAADDPDVDMLETLVTVASGVRQYQSAVEEAVAERDARIADLESRLNPAAETDEGDEGGEGDKPAEDPEPDEAKPDEDKPAETPETPAAPAPDPAPEPAPAPQEPTAVAASARSIDLSRVRRTRTPAPRDTAPSVDIIVASANLPGFEPGTNIDMAQLTAAVGARFSTFPQERIPNTYMRNPIAQIAVPFPRDLTQDDNVGRDQELLDHAGDMARLDGGSLTAAGGWCAPSETLYDLCPGLETNSGLVDIPEIQVTRGGIRTTEGPDFATLYAGAAI